MRLDQAHADGHDTNMKLRRAQAVQDYIPDKCRTRNHLQPEARSALEVLIYMEVP